MTAEQVATRHAARQVRLAREAARQLAGMWASVSRDSVAVSWRLTLPQALAALGAAQAAAAAAANVYVDDVLEASGAAAGAEYRVLPAAFAGIASDGRPLASLLQQPAIAALRQFKSGASVGRAMAAGAFTLDMIARTQLADAGRVATGVAIASRPRVTGYVRMVVGKTCSRCLILAGRTYKWNAGFIRHPRCDCRHIPTAENVSADVATNPRAAFDAMSRAEQDRVFTQAGAEAIRGGADMARVVNARRGMQTAAEGRLYTTEAVGRRPRLMPEQIYREAGDDRAEAVRLLRLHGYLSARI